MDRFRELIMTCGACPSQWKGVLKDGRHVYIRYRWGYLSVGIGETLDDAIRDHSYGIDFGGPYQGVMSTSEMLRHLDKFQIPDPGKEE